MDAVSTSGNRGQGVGHVRDKMSSVMPDKKAHECSKRDLLVLPWDPKTSSKHISFKGTHETCMPSSFPMDTSRGIEIHIYPSIRANGVSTSFRIWSPDKKAPLFEIYDIKMQIVGAVTQITVSAVELQPSVGTDLAYFMDYEIKFKR